VTAVRFEHLVEINDLTRPELPVLTRDELWRGLVVRAERPELFLPSLGGPPALSFTETVLVRVLRFGDVHVTDEVRFTEGEAIRYDVPAQGAIPRSSLSMHIEEPHAGRLFVRFVYEDAGAPLGDAGEAAAFDHARRAAYEAADVDTVATIRWLVESGELASIGAESMRRGRDLPE
jgi:hypothetical protein